MTRRDVRDEARGHVASMVRAALMALGVMPVLHVEQGQAVDVVTVNGVARLYVSSAWVRGEEVPTFGVYRLNHVGNEEKIEVLCGQARLEVSAAMLVTQIIVADVAAEVIQRRAVMLEVA